MSASPEKKTQARAQRDEKRRQEEQKDRRAMALYTTVGVVVVVAAVALMFWNSGILQRNLTALNVNGVKYTAAEVQYYYSSLYNEQASSYAFLPNVSVKTQVYDQETGQSWYDHLLEQAAQQLTESTAMAAKAESEGYTLSQEAQEGLESTLNQLNSAWAGYGYPSRDAFIRASFGAYMTYDKLVELVKQDILASDYAETQLDAIEHPDSDYEAYYKDNAGALDTIIYTQLTFRAGVPVTDEQGNSIEMSDEEKKAAIEEQKPAQKALAEEVKAKLEAGEDPEKLAEEYEDRLYSAAISRRASGANVSMSIAGPGTSPWWSRRRWTPITTMSPFLRTASGTRRTPTPCATCWSGRAPAPTPPRSSTTRPRRRPRSCWTSGRPGRPRRTPSPSWPPPTARTLAPPPAAG